MTTEAKIGIIIGTLALTAVGIVVAVALGRETSEERDRREKIEAGWTEVAGVLLSPEQAEEKRIADEKREAEKIEREKERKERRQADRRAREIQAKLDAKREAKRRANLSTSERMLEDLEEDQKRRRIEREAEERRNRERLAGAKVTARKVAGWTIVGWSISTLVTAGLLFTFAELIRLAMNIGINTFWTARTAAPAAEIPEPNYPALSVISQVARAIALVLVVVAALALATGVWSITTA